MKIITEYSLWLIFICIAFGIGISFLTYYNRFPENISKMNKRILPVLRFFATFFLAFLLLNPLFLRNVKEIEKPLVIFAHDNSTSIILTKDSAFYKTTFIKSLNDQIKLIENQFEIKNLSIGSKTENKFKFSYDEAETDLSDLFTELTTLYTGRNVGAIVLMSDGIYNKGSNPYFLAEKLPFPIYSVLMGDTSIQKDLKINKVFHNRTVFKGNSFPLEIHVGAHLFSGSQALLTIENQGKEVYKKSIQIKGNSFSETIRLYLEANQAGVQKYTIKIEELDGEYTYLNNKSDAFIEVMDRKEKILIVYQAPHPDVFAIKQALSSSESYFVEAKQLDEISNENLDYQLVILHQIPSVNNLATSFTNRLTQQKIPVLYILGNKSNYSAFNQLNSGLQITQSKALLNDAFVSLNPNFVLFSVPNLLSKTLERMPPLSVPFGSYKTSNSSNILLYQRIGQVASDIPMFVFSDIDNKRTGVLAGEGIWRWRVSSFQQNGDHLAFDELLIKISQYLMVSNDRSNFRITQKQIFNENEAVFFTAELYNDAMERINDSEVKLIIKNAEGKSFPFEFSRTSDAFELNAGKFPPGNYSWDAQTTIGNKNYSKSGVFTVQKLQMESLNLLADINLMSQLAKLNGGELIFARDIDKLSERIKQNESIRSVEFNTKKYTDLSSFWIYLTLIIALFVTEWFIRKLNGLS